MEQAARSRTVVAFFALATCVAAGAGCSASAGAPQPASEGASSPSVTFTIASHVAAGSTATLCQFVAMSQEPAFVTGFAHSSTSGLHHVYLFRTDLADVPAGGDTPFDCDDAALAPMEHARANVYATEAPSGSFDFPAGVGLPIKPGEVFLLQAHVLDAGTADVDASTSVTLQTSATDPGTHAGAFFFYDPFIHIAAGQVGHASMRCAIPSDVTVLTTVGSAREHAIGFAAFADPATGTASEPYYHAPGTADPLPLAASLPLAAGTHLRFTCTYDNTEGTQEFLQGTSATASEQCILSGLYYPDRGDDFAVCSAAPDAFGTGAATCSATRSCVEACPAGAAPPANLGLGGMPDVDACWQRCIAASCPKASGMLLSLRACTQNNCQQECSGDPGASDCTSCVASRCASESAACDEGACAL
jgi:hypothetical protein